jgi:hypothetical protein
MVNFVTAKALFVTFLWARACESLTLEEFKGLLFTEVHDEVDAVLSSRQNRRRNENTNTAKDLIQDAPDDFHYLWIMSSTMDGPRSNRKHLNPTTSVIVGDRCEEAALPPTLSPSTHY